MSVAQSVRRRPLAAGALGVVALAAALLVVPISYQHTVGYSVQLSAHVPAGQTPALQKIAAELAKAVGATNVSTSAGGAGQQIAFAADVPMRARAEVNARAQAFAHELTMRGFSSTAVVTPRTERVSGSVYAYAADTVKEIRVNATGMSDEQIASEIKTQLEAQGFSQPNVEVSTTGDKRQVKVTLSKTSETSDGQEPAPIVAPNITVTDDNKKSDSTTEEKRIELKLDHSDVAGKTDDEIKALVEQKLRDQGITNAVVTVKDGKVVNIEIK